MADWILIRKSEGGGTEGNTQKNIWINGNRRLTGASNGPRRQTAIITQQTYLQSIPASLTSFEIIVNLKM